MISEEYGDIYFSKEDGLAETRHVFLQGNRLPDRWAGRPRYCICETGFGTGLNFLAAKKLFEDTANPEQRLDYISIEKYPLTPSKIRDALKPWADELDVEAMLAQYPIRVRGFHRLSFGRVTLTLVFDDVSHAMEEISAHVDAWFLDGFAPAKNPDMWVSVLYQGMARLSRKGATFASFTAAGDVRRGLAQAGFAVEKRKGYGRKRDMIAGHYAGEVFESTVRLPRKAAIVGSGIAGLSAAWHLRREGCEVTVYDMAGHIAAGASGNRLGIINPKLTAKPTASSDYYAAAYAYALRMLPLWPDAGFTPHGGLHLQTDEDKARRFDGYINHSGWHADHMAMRTADEASDIAGIRLDVPCLHYPDTGAVGPALLCAGMASGIDVRLRQDLFQLPEADIVVLANASGVTRFFDLPVGRVRGQVTYFGASETSSRLLCNLSYGGYVAPAMADGLQVCGATFQPWSEEGACLPEDDAYNLKLLRRHVPAIGDGLAAVGGRVGFRASARDRLPIIGVHEGVFLSVAHGSHGVISGLMAGAIIAAAATGSPAPVGRSALAAVSPSRFR